MNGDQLGEQSGDRVEPSARESRKVAYPWLVEWLHGKFASVLGGESEPADVASIDFVTLRDEVVASDMPPEVRATVQHIGVRQLKEQYVRCVQFPKRLGTMIPHERESVLRVARENIDEVKTPEGKVAWTRLAEIVRTTTGVRISEGNLKNMHRKIVAVPLPLRNPSRPSAEKGGSGSLCADPDTRLGAPPFPSKRRKVAYETGKAASETGKAPSESGKVPSEKRAASYACSASSVAVRLPAFETVEGLTPTSTMRRVDEYLQELVRSCEMEAASRRKFQNLK